jgi:NADH dehydrogenase FAD-containing subunit
MTGYDYLILGGGYAGTICAQRLAGRLRGQGARIALVNPRPGFVERLRLHEGLAADRPPGLRSFDLAARLEPQGITVLHGAAATLDRARRRVAVTGRDGAGFDLGYRRLILALGSRQTLPPVPGLEGLAYVLEPDGPRGAAALRGALAALPAPRVVVISIMVFFGTATGR